MSALGYLFRTKLKNQIKKSLKKPVTYIYLLVGLVYIGYILFFISNAPEIFSSMQEFLAPVGLVYFLSIIAFVLIPANLITYAKRKGLIFTKADVHFLFTAPVNPKIPLCYAQMKNLLSGAFMSIFLVIIGIWMFHVPLWKMLVYYIFSVIIEGALETSMMVILYANERLTLNTLKKIGYLLYAVLGSLILLGAYLIITKGFSMQTAQILFDHPMLQCIPIIGWQIAVVRLLFLGPDILNICGTFLYCASTIALIAAAIKMKCTGEYYEDAMKFADDYAKAIEKSRKGEVYVKSKKYLAKAEIVYKGYFGKAIFYRQLLEYKKNRFFIFGISTLCSLGAGILICFILKEKDRAMPGLEFIIPGVMAYVVFIFSGYTTKWLKELENPYLFLIPDTPLKKLWYATAMEHVRSLIDGCLIAIPGSLMLKLPFVQVILLVLLYVCLQANKLYLKVLSEVLVGNVLGSVGKQFFLLFGQAICFGFGIAGAALGAVFISMETGFLLMVIITAAVTFVIGMASSTLFERMEKTD